MVLLLLLLLLLLLVTGDPGCNLQFKWKDCFCVCPVLVKKGEKSDLQKSSLIRGKLVGSRKSERGREREYSVVI